MPFMLRNAVAIAGPAGSGKDSIIRGVLARCSNAVFAVNATTRAPRPGEEHGKNYYFFSNEEFLKEVERGNIPEHYHRPDTDTYYGLYKPDLDKNVAAGKIALFQIQIVGAKYLKEHYDATTFFIMPPSLDAFEKRIRARAPMSDAEWEERRKFTEREVKDEAPFYDYRIQNDDGKLEAAIEEVVEILKKEGYTLGA
jgi:guanylate kinase